jgi:hypothetical protein
MKISKGILAAIMVVALAAPGVTAFAATGTPAEVAANLDAFKAEMLKVKRAQLDAKVDAGVMTKERADEIYAALEKKQVNCDGAGQARLGRAVGANFGKDQSKGSMMGAGCGKAQSKGNGEGVGFGKGQDKGGGTDAGLRLMFNQADLRLYLF